MRDINEVLRKLYPETGYLTEEQWRAHDERIKAERERAAFEERNAKWKQIKAALIERGLAERHLREIHGKPIVATNAIKAVTAIAGDGVYVLSGNVGCGKTYAAHVWLLDATRRKPLEWRPSHVRMVTAAWFARESRYGAKFDAIQSPRMLVVDDLGMEYADEARSFLVDLDEMLDIRWRSGAATLVTTNLVASDFAERYGKRIADRVRAKGHWFNVQGESLR